MRKRFTRILAALALLVFMTPSLAGWGQTVTWERVTSIQTLFDGGTFIMGYEATAKSGTIVPLRSKDSNATTSANGYFNTGTTNNSSTNGTISMSNLTGVTTSDYEVYITGIKVTENAQQVYKYINIQRNNSSGNYYGATSGGSTSNKARLYTSGNSNETNLLPEWSSETNNQFKFTANVTGDYKYLAYNSGSPRFAFYKSGGTVSEKIVFYKKIVKHTLTYSATNGSIGGVEYGTSTAVASGASVAEGDKVTLTAQPDDGYVFSSWEVSGTGSSLSSTSTNPTTFTMGTANATVTANFVAGIAYTITAQSNNNNYGTVALNGNVITANPAAGYTYASPAYTVSSGTATVEQNGNEFTVTPTSDCTVTINFAAIPTHTATFSVNGATTTQDFMEGASIVFPSNPANISGKAFVGWITSTIDGTTDDEPEFVTSATMGNSNITYYAVFATAIPSVNPVETLTQTLQYDTWTYSGTTTDKTTYRLFGNGSYIESAAFDLSKLSKVKVWGGTFGGSYNSLTIGDGTNIWKSGTVTTSGGIGTDEFTNGNALTGTNVLRITATAGNGTTTGLRISKIEIYTLVTTYTYSAYCTNFEVFTITAQSNNNSYGTVSLSDNVITGSPLSGYRYASPAYTVSPANSATVVQIGNEFTVTPSANTTVTINFEAIPTYKATFYVNGTKNSEVNLVEGADIDFPEVADLTDLKFVGWTTSAINGTVASEPATLVTEATMGTSDIDYYAVFAYKQKATFNAADITNTPLTSYLTWTHSATGISIQLSAGQRYTSGTPNTFTVTKGTSNYLEVSSTNKYLEKVVVTISGTDFKVNSVQSGASLSTSSTTQTITFTSKMTSVKCYATSGNQIRATNVSVTVLTDYCTNINSFITDGNWNVAGNWAQNAVPSSGNVIINAACTIPNGTIANVKNVIIGTGSLIVKDGGQLICNNAVEATVEKSIAAATDWGTASNGWYFIASPLVDNTDPDDVNNMITPKNGDDYTFDLYRYNDAAANNLAWENYRNHTDFELVNGQGYLYANVATKTLEFAGEIKPYTTTGEANKITIGPGFNLIGNPYTFATYINKPYYKLNAEGNTILASEVKNVAINPCTGVIVNGGVSGYDIFFTETSQEIEAVNPGNIQMALAQTVATRGSENTETIDNAIVSFNEGSELPKFYFGTQNANIYIPLDNEEYAIVSSNAQGEMPVNFRAYVAGEYTITVNPEEVEMGYLHLIDNIAGKDIDLLATPSYTFNARTDDYESRFRLVFSTTMVNAEMGEDFAFISDGQLVIANEGEAILQVIDVTGRVVAIENINGTCSKAINAKAGVYVLRLINGTDVKTQKMVIR